MLATVARARTHKIATVRRFRLAPTSGEKADIPISTRKVLGSDTCTAAKPVIRSHRQLERAMWVKSSNRAPAPFCYSIRLWNFVGCSPGRSAGFAPLMILSTYDAERSYSSGKFGERVIAPPAAVVSRLTDMSAIRYLVTSSTRVVRCGSKSLCITTACAPARARKIPS